MSSDAGVVAIKNLIALCVCAGIVVLIGYLGYSQTECSLVSSGNVSELTFVIEGDIDPKDCTLRVSGRGGGGGYSSGRGSVVVINNVTYPLTGPGSDGAIDSWTPDLKHGRNHIRLISVNRTTATLSYDVQWKPLIKRFQIADLEVGSESDFFIYADSDVSQSHLKIATENGEVIFNQTFNGSKTRIKIDEIGNYDVHMRVLGSGWSETYYSEFTAFAGVLRTIDNVPLIRSRTDRPAYSSTFPLTIERSDRGFVLILKRACNGYHRLMYGRLLPYTMYAKGYLFGMVGFLVVTTVATI